MNGLWRARRGILAVAGIVWLAGFHFFFDGFHHMAAFWLVLAPLAVVNLDLLSDSDRVGWKRLLGGLLAWQLACGLIHTGEGRDPVDGVSDALAIVLLVVAVLALGRVGWGWQGLRIGLFAAGVVATGWSLVRFYPMSDLGLADERLRNVLVYSIGLNAVLTGLLAGFSMIAGLGLVRRDSSLRWVVYAGLAVLGFALMAAQSRGALLAAGAGALVMLVAGRGKIMADLAACLVGAGAYLIVFAATADAVAPDLIDRGSTGRMDIWKNYLGGLGAGEWWIGTGRVPPLEKSALGWYVHHPHGSWVSQIVWCGLPGLALLVAFVGWAGVVGLRDWGQDASALALLAFGVAGLIFDGAQVVSLASLPRIEPLLVLVPSIFLLDRSTT